MAEKGIQTVMRDMNNRVSFNKTHAEVFGVAHGRTLKKHGVARQARPGKILANATKAIDNTHDKSTWDIEQYMHSWLACNHLPAGNFHI